MKAERPIGDWDARYTSIPQDSINQHSLNTVGEDTQCCVLDLATKSVLAVPVLTYPRDGTHVRRNQCESAACYWATRILRDGAVESEANIAMTSMRE